MLQAKIYEERNKQIIAQHKKLAKAERKLADEQRKDTDRRNREEEALLKQIEKYKKKEVLQLKKIQDLIIKIKKSALH